MAMGKLAQLGFKPVGAGRRRMFITGEGQPKVGKTHFFRTCPPPIAVIDFDRGLEGVAERDIWGNEILRLTLEMPDLDQFSKSTSAAERDVALKSYAQLKTTVIEVFRSGEIATLGVDTGTAAYSLAQVARFGQMAVVGEVPPSMWTAMQAEFEGIFNKYSDYGCNLVMMHRQGSKYRGVMGETELKGYKQMQFLSQIHLDFLKRVIKDEKGAPVKNASGAEMFELVRKVKTCRQRLALEGTEFPVFFTDEEMVNSVGGDFATIAQAVFPMSKLEEWGLPQ